MSVIPEDGVLSRLSTLARSASGLLRARVALATLELADARDALFALLFIGALAVVAAGLGLFFLSLLVVALAWDALGWRILLILAACYVALGWWLWRRAQTLLTEGRIGLPLTLSELKKDREALLSGLGAGSTE